MKFLVYPKNWRYTGESGSIKRLGLFNLIAGILGAIRDLVLQPRRVFIGLIVIAKSLMRRYK